MACGVMVWALATSPIGLWADNNESDFGDSAPFPLDTTDQATYGMGDSNGFRLDTGRGRRHCQIGFGDLSFARFQARYPE